MGARIDELDEAAFSMAIKGQIESVLSELESDGLVKCHLVEHMLACRYAGQNYEHEIRLTEVNAGFLRRATESFHAAHSAAFGYSFPDEPVEVVHVRVTARELADVELVSEEVRDEVLGQNPDERVVIDEKVRPVRAMVLRRRGLSTSLSGPVIIEEPDSTAYVPSGWTVSSAAGGCLELEKTEG